MHKEFNYKYATDMENMYITILPVINTETDL